MIKIYFKFSLFRGETQNKNKHYLNKNCNFLLMLLLIMKHNTALVIQSVKKQFRPTAAYFQNF